MAQTIAIDVGGTFVDFVVADRDRLRVAKEPSGADAGQAVLNGLRRLVELGIVDPKGVAEMLYASTVATNALLERTWARTALVTTEGFRDVLEIGRQNRASLYDLGVRRPLPLVPRNLRFEVRERVTAEGEVEMPLNMDDVERVAGDLVREHVEAVAVAFLFSYLRPEHERRVVEALSVRLGVPIVASSDVLPVFREVERISTTVVCAALRPKIDVALQSLEEGAAALGLPRTWRVMQSNGAVVGARRAADNPARLVLSGPAGGVEAIRWLGREVGEPNVIGIDMGGTSCDVSVVTGGEAEWTAHATVGGYPVALPAVAVHSIGAGGGSIAWLDGGGALRVGPQSAGADPGPACYGRGGARPTVTDAHLVLGRVVADLPIGSLTRLDTEAARAALGDDLAGTLGVPVEQVALGILDVAEAAMERAIRVMTVERGQDPRDYALVAFGGAGPLHAVSLARRLGIERVVIPRLAGVLSAFGLLVAEAGHDESLTILQLLGSMTGEDLETRVAPLVERGRAALCGEGFAGADVRFRVTADMRYVGQSHEVSVPVRWGAGALSPGEVRREFDAAHERRFGHAALHRDVELVTLRVRAHGPEPRRVPAAEAAALSHSARREVLAWFDSRGAVPVHVHDRAQVEIGRPLRGPAILVGGDTTVVIPPGARGVADASGHLHVEVG
ncbi:MAG: hydantoinase/oxoprolinase family protein [Candidatus Bipolaricaulota bacterium]